jgi:hypothetical protein
MKTNKIKIVLLVMTFMPLVRSASGQGFVNLDFENPILPLNPVNFQVSITNALPGWTGYVGNNVVSRVVYDTVSLGAAAISFQDSSGFISLQGQYCVGLQSTDPGNQFMAALAQVGQVPPDALSINFVASHSATLELTFAGQAIPLVEIGTTILHAVEIIT